MIVKRIPLRNPNVSSFTRLTEYITNSQGKHERVENVRLTNCHCENAAWAKHEIELVQAQNTRTKMDKTYHLLISFREGERPPRDMIHAIEDKMCAEIGYADHQRISAVHSDTDHLHLHIAINKIHPKKFTAHEPYYDKRKLGALAEKLEIEYKLERDNHTPQRTASEARAQDMEKAAGLESLIGWVKRGCLKELLTACSWKEIHRTLAENGLKIIPSGNGLVITDGKGHAAKASSIDRQLSKSALENRLGAYAAPDISKIRPAAQYQVKPMPSKVDTQPLWEAYLKEQEQFKQLQSRELKQAIAHRKKQIQNAKSMSKIHRAGIKLIKSKFARKILYQSAFQKLMKNIQNINQEYEQKYQTIYGNNKRLVWHDWLKAKAQAGNQDALEVLRNRYAREAKHKNVMTGNFGDPAQISNRKIENVTKKGTIHYQLPKTVLRDDGKKFWLANDANDKAIQQALQMAVKRFGSRLEINGTEEFRISVINIAASSRIRVTFADADMEAKRKALIEKNTTHYRNHSIQEYDALKYIRERNDKNEKGIAVLKHRLYNSTDADIFSYAGVRQMNNTHLLLLQTQSEMLVMPIDAKTAYRVKSMKVGSKIEVTGDHVIHNRSRVQAGTR